MNGWEKAKIVGTLIASIAIPVVIALVGHWYTQAENQRQFGLRYVELAVSILVEEPGDHDRELRSWAVEIINQNSRIKLPSKTREELIDRRLQISPALDGNLKSSRDLLEELRRQPSDRLRITPRNQ